MNTRHRSFRIRSLAAALLILACLLLTSTDIQAQAQTQTQTAVPDVPTVNPLIAGETWLGVAWSAPSSGGGITAYDLRHIETSEDETDDANWTVIDDVWTAGSGDLAYVLTGRDNGATYDVQVRAVNSEGDGAWSDTQSASPGDYGDSLTAATELILATSSEGAIDPDGDNVFPGSIESASDEDYFKIVLTDEQVPSNVEVWLYTRTGNPDTIGELLNEDGEIIRRNDGAGLDDPREFSMWPRLGAGTYYLKVAGFGSEETGDYVLHVHTIRDVVCGNGSAPLQIGDSAKAIMYPRWDADCFRLTVYETTDVILRSSGLPRADGQLLDSDGNVIASNDNGVLGPEYIQFLIRRSLSPGTYYLKVTTLQTPRTGPYTVHATEAGRPGNTMEGALPLTLGVAAGGRLSSGNDKDYFRFTLEDDTFVRIWTSANVVGVLMDGELLDENGDAVTNIDFHTAIRGYPARFGIEDHLSAGTYYIKVTSDLSSSGKYTILVTEDVNYHRFSETCNLASTSPGINDQYYRCQWHMDNDNQFPYGDGEDINVEPVWNSTPPVLGTGISVAVVDTGMDDRHEDLRDNVDRTRHHNYVRGGGTYNPGSSHGTAVAGIIAARDNEIGMRGVAPRATIYSHNYLAMATYANQADAMARNAATTAISNNSWEPHDSASPTTATEIWKRAVEAGITDGYNGRGVLYILSAGNNGLNGSDSNLSEYTAFHGVTTVCAVNHNGERAAVSERGANLWVCAPSRDKPSKTPGIATTSNGDRYQNNFGGTSAAAPIVSGVAALVRSANNDLTWRDVKLILAASARKNDASNSGWEVGASKYGATGNYNFNHEYGFGVVDAHAAVNLAQSWTNVPDFRETSATSGNIDLSIPDRGRGEAPTTVSSTLMLDGAVEFIEYIHVEPHLDHESFRDLHIELVSPTGATSTLAPHFYAHYTQESAIWPMAVWDAPFRFGSAKHLGESSEGEWTLRITDHDHHLDGTLKNWKITALGHRINPDAPAIDGLQAAPGGYAVSWTAPDDPGRSEISAYDVRHILTGADETDDSNWTVSDDVWTEGDLQYSASGLTAGVQYDVQVRAANSNGDGPWSSARTVTPELGPPPAVPSGISSKPIWSGIVDLWWRDVQNADSYDVQFWLNDGWVDLPGDNMQIAFYGAGAVMRGLPTGGLNFFRVRAVNAAGASDWSRHAVFGGTQTPSFYRNVPRPTNSPATGSPIISGTVAIGETLSADTSGIADDNGLERVWFHYQWIRDGGDGDTDIDGATGQSYTLAASDVGASIKVRVSFVDRHGFSETLTSAATDTVQATANSSATGAPTVSGTARVGETLSADTSGVEDADGLDNVSFAYQWLADDSDISDATEAAYTLTAAEVGSVVSVRVSFTDDGGNEETLTSTATASVASAVPDEPPAKPSSLTAPDISHDSVTLTWADPQDDTITGYIILRRDKAIHEEGTFATVSADTGTAATTYTDTSVQPERRYVYRIKALNARGESEISSWVRAYTPAAPSTEPNSPATGAPTITGTAQVGETLTADTSGIADEDGLDNAAFSYQWIRTDGTTDTDLDGATDTSFILTADEAAQTLKVRVSFTDDAGNDESRTSEPTSEVAAILASTLTVGSADDGNGSTFLGYSPFGGGIGELSSIEFQLDGKAQFVSLILLGEGGLHLGLLRELETAITFHVGPVEFRSSEATCQLRRAMTYNWPEADLDWAVGDTVALAITQAEEPETQTACNRVATGAVAIGGTAQVGETLSADTSGIADENGLDNATFSYQWLADGNDISGATGYSYTLTSDEVGQPIKVRVSFTDDDGYAETLTSAATASVVRPPLTAEILNVSPSSHDGENTFTFELRFSENPDLSYVTLRDHAFTVVGSEITNVRRLERNSSTPNVRWEITVQPSGNAEVTVTLPATVDCADAGAICTYDGRKLSEQVEHTVSGPSG